MLMTKVTVFHSSITCREEGHGQDSPRPNETAGRAESFASRLVAEELNGLDQSLILPECWGSIAQSLLV